MLDGSPASLTSKVKKTKTCIIVHKLEWVGGFVGSVKILMITVEKSTQPTYTRRKKHNHISIKSCETFKNITGYFFLGNILYSNEGKFIKYNLKSCTVVTIVYWTIHSSSLCLTSYYIIVFFSYNILCNNALSHFHPLHIVATPLNKFQPCHPTHTVIHTPDWRFQDSRLQVFLCDNNMFIQTSLISVILGTDRTLYHAVHFLINK